MKKAKRNILIAGIISALILFGIVAYFFILPQSIINPVSLNCAFNQDGISLGCSIDNANLELFHENTWEQENVTFPLLDTYDLYDGQFPQFKSFLIANSQIANQFFTINQECYNQGSTIRFNAGDSNINLYKTIGIDELGTRNDDGTACQGAVYFANTDTVVRTNFPNQLIKIDARIVNYYDESQFVSFKAYGLCDLNGANSATGSCNIRLPATKLTFTTDRVKTVIDKIEIPLKVGGYTQADIIALQEADANTQKTYYRFSDNSCSAITIMQSEKTTNDYETLSQCEANIITGECEDKVNMCGGSCPPCKEPTPNYFLLAIIILTPISILIGLIWLVIKKRR